MSTDSFNLFKFYQLLQYKFDFFQLIDKFLMDGRIFPEIPLEKIILSITSMPLLGISSLLQLDQINREDFQKSLLDSEHRDMVVSDSAIIYALRKVYKQDPNRLGGVVNLLYECFLNFRTEIF